MEGAVISTLCEISSVEMTNRVLAYALKRHQLPLTSYSFYTHDKEDMPRDHIRQLFSQGAIDKELISGVVQKYPCHYMSQVSVALSDTTPELAMQTDELVKLSQARLDAIVQGWGIYNTEHR